LAQQQIDFLLAWVRIAYIAVPHEVPRMGTALRVDVAGLAWFVGDGRVVAMTAESAAIESASGSRLTYRRRPPRDIVVIAGAGRGGGVTMSRRPRRPPKQRNPIARAVTRLRPKVKPIGEAV
jgi:hypothetical protein